MSDSELPLNLISTGHELLISVAILYISDQPLVTFSSLRIVISKLKRISLNYSELKISARGLRNYKFIPSESIELEYLV